MHLPHIFRLLTPRDMLSRVDPQHSTHMPLIFRPMETLRNATLKHHRQHAQGSQQARTRVAQALEWAERRWPHQNKVRHVAWTKLMGHRASSEVPEVETGNDYRGSMTELFIEVAHGYVIGNALSNQFLLSA